MNAYYDFVFILSAMLTIVYVYKWRKFFDVHISLIYVLVPVITLTYALLCRSSSPEEAIALEKLTYIGGCFLELIILLIVFTLCGIRIHRAVKVLFFLLSTAVYLSVLGVGDSHLFYTSVRVEIVDELPILVKEYGIMHYVFRWLVFFYFALSLGVIIYAYFRKNQVSRKILFLLLIPEAIAVVVSLGRASVIPYKELIPAAYVAAQAVYLIIVSKLPLYDVADTAMDSLAQNGDTGLLSIDLKYRYLGSNETAKKVFPDLLNLTVDHSVDRVPAFQNLVQPWLEDFQEDEAHDT